MGSIRILFVNSARASAGGPTSGLDLATGLHKLGHPLLVVCHPDGVMRERLQDAGVDTAPIAIKAELNFWRLLQLARVIRRFRPDVVLADRRKDVKFAFGAIRVNPGTALVHRHGAPSPLRHSPLYRAVWSRLSGLILNSEYMRRVVLERTPWMAGVRIDVIHNGKDLEYWKPMPEEKVQARARLGIPADAFVVVFHGVLQSRKNVDQLISACAAMRRPAHALIIGDGPEADHLREHAAGLGVSATFTGHRKDLPQALSAGDVMAHLSSAEGFSNSVIEALACGLPVVASRATSHTEQVDDGVTGRLTEPGNVRAVARALDSLHEDEDLRCSMARAARAQAVARFDIERMLELYSQALLRAANSP